MRAIELTESAQPLEDQTAIEWAITHSNRFVHNQTPVFRGLDSELPYILVDPKASNRPAFNIRNHINLLVSNLPSWKHIPRRSNSVICSTSKFQAMNFGNLYLVYPMDNAIFGVTPNNGSIEGTNDFWAAFGTGQGADVPSLNRLLNNMAEDMLLKPLEGSNYSVMMQQLERMDELHKQKGKPFDGGSPLVGFFNKYGIVKGLEKFLDPTFRGFATIGIDRLHSYKNREVEIWTESTCLLVKHSYADSFEGAVLTS